MEQGVDRLEPARRDALRRALATDRPILCVIVDTEEEFDWTKPLCRANRAVTAIPAQARAHAIFAEFGVVPTYVVDYPVATDPAAAAFLRNEMDAGRCAIGAHCHPWVNPPDEERVTPHNSYHGNLPPDLERRKLTVLTDAVARAFGQRPTVYKAGRYGLGPNTPAILADLGYRVDASVVPHTSFARDGGPDFTGCPAVPGPLPGAPSILELPLSVGFAGRLRRYGPALQARVFTRSAVQLHVPGALARSGMLERIRLSPEGSRASDHIRLTRALLADGVRVLAYTYHSPSLVPGNTPYVRSELDLQRFLDDLRRYVAYVIDDLGGIAATPTELDALWRDGVRLDAVSGANTAAYHNTAQHVPAHPT